MRLRNNRRKKQPKPSVMRPWSGVRNAAIAVLLAVNVFQIMASGVVIPTAYLPELFGKIGTFFPLTFWDSYYLK